MKLIALLLARNEEHEIGLSLRVLLKFCDAVVIMEHRCIDRTHEIVCQCAGEVEPGRVIVAADDHEQWDEMRLRDTMLRIARQYKATHLWLGDADEVLSSGLLPKDHYQKEWRVVEDSCRCGRCLIERLQVSQILQLPLYNLRGGITKYHSNGVWGQRWGSVAFKDHPSLTWSGDRFHAREPQGIPLRPYQPIAQGQGGIMHLWASSLDRLRAKHRLYRVSERCRWPSKSVAQIERMYSWAERGDPSNPSFGTPATWKYSDVPAEWWAGYEDLMPHLNLDAPNWQDAECNRLIAQYGREYFKGLTV